MTLADEKKGITVKIDADLHAEVKEYIEQHGMTMAEFITLAVDNELHPKYQNKEEKNMEITYRIEHGMRIPDLTLPLQPKGEIGKYGRMRLEFLKTADW